MTAHILETQNINHLIEKINERDISEQVIRLHRDRNDIWGKAEEKEE